MGEPFGGEDPAMGSPDGGIEATGDATLDRDCIRAVLDDARRRHVLQIVSQLRITTTRDLATQIAAREHEVDPAAVTEAERRDLTIELYHVHLPKLADAGVVTVDRGVERIQPGPNATVALDALRDLSEQLADGSESPC